MRSRVELTMDAAVPVDPVEMRAAAVEAVHSLSETQLEVMVWFAAFLLEQAETKLPEAKMYPALERATAARLGIRPADLVLGKD